MKHGENEEPLRSPARDLRDSELGRGQCWTEMTLLWDEAKLMEGYPKKLRCCQRDGHSGTCFYIHSNGDKFLMGYPRATTW